MNVMRLAAGSLAVLAAAATISACGSSAGGDGAGNGLGGSGPTAAKGQVAVVAAENFWGDITRQLGGSHVAVTSIISDPNTNPHEYESDVGNAAAIAKADLVIENGAGYDDFMGKLLGADKNSKRTVLNVADTVGLEGSNPNPHLWYSPTYVQTTARAIAAQLTKRQPASAPAFRANLAHFLAGEGQAVAVIDQIRAKYAGTAIAYTERVPGYLVTAAGLHLGTPAAFSQAIEDDSEPSPADNATFEQDLTDRKVAVLLYNAQVTDAETSHLKSLARSSHVPVVGVTETMPPSAANFQAWQGDQARALLAALGG